MPLSRTRDYLSIGEVLELVRPEFPDVSISKIRFLEAEGLIAPERTASGYRKFYDTDVKRLRYILGLQRDQFLPLKVIRERLVHFDADGAVVSVPAPDAEPAPAKESVATTDVSLSRSELLQAAGMTEKQLTGLEEFGIMAATDRYDGNDLVVAKAARGLFEFGIEPRHLRMYRQLADREASFIEQIVSPITRKKDSEARKEAARSASRLMQLSRSMRDALVRAGLRDVL
ncbi:MAG: MerR family transcriptional regulator [Actinomycetota bacterium]|nr:MerR family transcriptional regulator [Actinomycetota bacterium]